MRRNTEEPIESDINDLCEQAGCNPKQRIAHAWKWEIKRWHSHPSIAFQNWWNPTDTDPESGAHIGGHPDARRQWARKDEGRWIRKWYGTSCLDAWNAVPYLEEFDAWLSAGSPEKDTPFISVALPYDVQTKMWGTMKSIIDKIGKKMPKPTPLDTDSTEFQPY